MIKKVALVSPYALSVPGGVQEQVLAMSRELSRRGIAVLIVAPDTADKSVYDTPAQVSRFGRLLSLPANGSKAPVTLSRRAGEQAFRAIQMFGPEVVHFHEPFAPRLGWFTLRARAFPAVGTFHRSGGGPAITMTGPLLRRLSRTLDSVVAVSEMAAGTYARSLVAPAKVLFNGFEIDRFGEFPKSTPPTKTLLVLGRLEERKGVATAIEAVLLHNRTSPEPWTLRILGDGPERAALERLARGNREIVFVGRVGDSEKRRELRSASALIAPALYGESFGLTLIEGLASELAVVASDIDGYRQAGRGHVTLAPAGSANAFEQAIAQALASDSESRRTKGVEHAANWSMKALIDAYLDVYAEASAHFRAL